MFDYQIGVFAITDKTKGKIALVTSRTGERWIFPKGHPEKGRSDKKIALEEAYEEAGLQGSLKSKPHEFDVYYGRTKKLRLYCMKVEKQLKDWPERKERKLKFVTIDEAEKMLSKDLVPVLRTMAKQHL